MTKDSTEGPRLSNFLTVLAVEVAGELAAYKRSSTAAHRAYLAAGAKLLDARAAAKRGEWAPFLTACGDDLDERTAQRMMQLARSGLTPDDVTAAGGVRGALESLREARERDSAKGKARRAARGHLRDCVVGQSGLCGICGRPLAGDLGHTHVDHKVPLDAGGTSDRANLHAAHAICNLVKGARGFYPFDDGESES